VIKEDILKNMYLAGSAYSQTQADVFGGGVRVIDDAESGIQCFLRRDGGTLYITFRGSDSPKDWQTNLYFRRLVIPYGNTKSKIRMHAGFIYAYNNDRVRPQLHSAAKNTDKIVISGHSLGAALSIVCAVDIQYNFPEKDIEVYAYGGPRVGNLAFIRSYNKRVFKTFRVENGNDIVTKLPPAIFGYRHAGIKVHVGQMRLPLVFSFNQHRPENYAKNIIRDFYNTS